MIRVLVVDDHQLVRAGLMALLGAAPDLEVVGQAADGEAALKLAHDLRPDVVLMDLSMPVLDGVEATRRLVAEQPDACVVVLTSFTENERVTEALEAGAIGYLLKDSDPHDLLRGIRAAARGESPLDPRVAGVVLREGGGHGPRAAAPAAAAASTAGAPGSASPPGGALDLTAREREVLLLVREGLANKQIATRLGITLSTVKAHLSSAFVRIGVADRTSAAVWAQHHLVDGTSPSAHGGHSA